jgi:hypothetical protein
LDLRIEAERLRLDALAVLVSAELTRNEIPHALLKGPSTANWLYDPPRAYRDVDILLSPRTLDRAVHALDSAGIAFAQAGRPGEEAQHSMLLISADGFEVDVHLSLPTLPVGLMSAWDVLRIHVETLDLGLGSVPKLDEPGRCLVLALHALNSGGGSGQPIEDLRRARVKAAMASWEVAAQLAAELGAQDLFSAAITLVEGDPEPVAMASPRARLYADGAPSGAFGLQRLSETRLRGLPRAVWREIFPTPGFMRRAEPGRVQGWHGLMWAYMRRLTRLGRQFGPAVAAWSRAHRR